MSDILASLVEAPKRSKESEKRKARGEKDFRFFCETYLPHYFSAEPAPYHLALYEIINNQAVDFDQLELLKKYIKKDYHPLLTEGKISGIIDAEPRGFGKSVRLSFAFVLWSLLYKKRRFIMIVGASSDSASSNLNQVKTELEENELILEDFSELKGEVWKNNYIELKNDTALVARGAGSSMRGIKFKQYRPDLVILDDILKDEAAESQSQRDKIFIWVKRVIFPLGKDIFFVFVNTIFHSDDLICRLFSEIEEKKLKNFLGLRFSAITPSGDSLWESYWSLSKLEEKRMQLGNKAFSTEYMNEPLSEADQVFKKSWLSFFELSEININSLELMMACDPATGAHDLSAISVVGYNREFDLYYVLESWGKRCTPKEFIQKIIEKYLFWKPKKIGFETVTFQKVFKEYLMECASSLGVYLPIEELTPKGIKKEIRLSSLSPFVESGKMLFRKSQKELLEEMETFPRGVYDDELDALEYARSLFTRGRKAMPQVVPCGVRPSSLSIKTETMMMRFKR